MRAPSDQRGSGTPGPANSLSEPASRASIVRSLLFIKYLALFVAVVSLALIANGAFDIFFSYNEQKASLVRIQREQAEAAAGKIGQFITEIESQVGWTTQLPWSASTLEQRRFDALRLLRQVPATTELAEIDSDPSMQYHDPLNAGLVLPFQRPRDGRSTLPVLPSLPQLGFLRCREPNPRRHHGTPPHLVRLEGVALIG
jgi:hypothetical protein